MTTPNEKLLTPREELKMLKDFKKSGVWVDGPTAVCRWFEVRTIPKAELVDWAESFYLDVNVIVCDCGEKYRDSDLGLRVNELKDLLSNPQDR